MDGVVPVAEELCAGYYKLSSLDSSRYPYEIVTQADVHFDSEDPTVFAEVSKHEIPSARAPRGGTPRVVYRINVLDRNILNAVSSKGDISLQPLLLYILTHELVHVVRFCDFRTLFESEPEVRVKEEHRVHDITFRILSRLRRPDLRPILQHYEPFRIAAA